METIKTVGIKTLKNQLSLYLREVKAGSIVLITERGNVIAELHKPTMNTPPLANGSIQTKWIQEGKLIAPKIRKKKCLLSPLKKNAGTAIKILDQERGE